LKSVPVILALAATLLSAPALLKSSHQEQRERYLGVVHCGTYETTTQRGH
jgi:hypothetical protein